MSDTMTEQGPGGPRWTGLPQPLGDIRRSDSDRWVAGVAGGLARHFGIESWIVRLIVAVLMMVGIGLPLYVLAWILIPSDETQSVAVERGWNRNTVIAISVLVVVGSLLTFGPDDIDAPWRVMPWLLVGLGVFLIVRSQRSTGLAPTAPVPAAGGAAPDSPTPSGGTAAAGAHLTPPSPPVPPPPPVPPAPRPKSLLTPLTLSAIVALIGAAVLHGGTGWSRPEIVAATSLCLMGAALVVSAFVGRARALIPLGLILAVPVLFTATIGPHWADWGDHTYRPQTVRELRSSYELGVGRTVLDLRAVDLPDSRTTRIRVEQGVGQIVVWLPPDSTTNLHAEMGMGEITFLEQNERLDRDDDFGPDFDDDGGDDDSEEGLGREVRRRLISGSGEAELRLDVSLGAGEIVIRQGGSLPAPSAPEPTTVPAPTTTVPTTTTVPPTTTVPESMVPTTGGPR